MESLQKPNLSENSPGCLKWEELRDASTALLLREVRVTQDPILKSRLYEQACNQECTHISEVLSGIVRTRFEFEAYNGKLYLLQPNGVTDWQTMHQNGLDRARAHAEANPDFAFYPMIAEAELEESKMQEKMIQEDKPAVMVRLSLCGADIASSESLEVIGRDPQLQRAFLRTSVFDGRLALNSRSLDGMTIERARKLYKNVFGIELAEDISSIDILKMPVVYGEGDMSTSDMHKLADRIVEAYDQIVFEETGEVHKAGRNLQQSQDTFRFVLANPDLISAHIGSLDRIDSGLDTAWLAYQSNELRYDIMSSFKQRLEGVWVDWGNLAESVIYAGLTERAAGTKFYGCDSRTESNDSLADSSGYVNAQNPEAWDWKDGKCRITNCPTRTKKEKVKVGPCQICQQCQKLFNKKFSLNEIDNFYKYGFDRSVPIVEVRPLKEEEELAKAS